MPENTHISEYYLSNPNTGDFEKYHFITETNAIEDATSVMKYLLKNANSASQTRDILGILSKNEISIVPTQNGTVTYNSLEQSPNWNNYNTSELTIGGVYTATNAGTYTAIFTPKNDYMWNTEPSNESKPVTWTIERATVTPPTISNTTKTYNTNSQSPTISSYDNTIISITGDTSAINAGTYTITISLLDTSNYKWNDNTTDPKTVNWTIERAPISTVPSQSGTLTYNTNSQSPSWNNYDTNQLTLSGTTIAIDSGSYIATFTPKANYIWSDEDTIDSKNITWNISKAQGSLSLSKSSISLSASKLTDTITVTRNGNGTISVVSSNTSIAIVDIFETTITVTAVSNGSATITVSVLEGTNYLAPTNATASVNVALMPAAGKTLNNYTWNEIQQISQAGYGDNYFDVGDCKAITLNGKMGDYLTLSNLTLYVYILDFNHTEGTKGNLNGNHIVFGGFKTALTSGKDVALCDWSGTSEYNDPSSVSTACFRMNRGISNSGGNYGGNYGGWKGTDIRYGILGATSTQPSNYLVSNAYNRSGYDATSSTISNPVANTFMSCIPSDLRSVIKIRDHWVDNVGGGTNTAANVTSVKDACFLLSEYEVQGVRTYANSTEQSYQTRMQYYTNGNSKVKYNHQHQSTAVRWWCCSPFVSTTYHFCSVHINGSANGVGACYATGVAPAFII